MFQNLDILRNQDPEYLLILAGDHIYKMDYGKMLAYHVAKSADMTVACLEIPVEEGGAFGVMSVGHDWRVTDFYEKPAQPAAISGKRGRASKEPNNVND